MNSKKPHETIIKISQSIIEKLQNNLDSGTLTKKQVKAIEDELSRVTLFSTLFKDELDALQEMSTSEISEVFRAKFPEELIEDQKMMETFNIIGKRIQHMREKYNHVKIETSKAINEFLRIEVPLEALNPQKLRKRIEHVNQWVFMQEKNIKSREQLYQAGYSEALFLRDHYIQVEIDDKKNLEENFRLALAGCFGEYVDILKTLDVNQKLVMQDKAIPLDQLFTEENLTVEQLKERRNVVTTLIDQKIQTHSRKNYYINRKLTMLGKVSKLVYFSA